MIVLLFCVCGLAFGVAVSIVWWSAHVFLGTQMLTPDQVLALVGLGTVGSAVFIGVMLAVDAWRR